MPPAAMMLLLAPAHLRAPPLLWSGLPVPSPALTPACVFVPPAWQQCPVISRPQHRHATDIVLETATPPCVPVPVLSSTPFLTLQGQLGPPLRATRNPSSLGTSAPSGTGSRAAPPGLERSPTVSCGRPPLAPVRARLPPPRAACGLRPADSAARAPPVASAMKRRKLQHVCIQRYTIRLTNRAHLDGFHL